jgi:glycerol-3-phosphate dehydrogenase
VTTPNGHLAPTRESSWRELGDEVFDLFVIGGGINGAAVARDAVLRGMSVALIERTDFAAGTSSRSSKLIHGGIRYLEQGDIGLVLEACRERDLLRSRLAPHLVRAQPFVFPIYRDDALPVWQLRIGLVLYDLLAGFSNVRTHRMLSAEQMREHEPALLAEGLEGGALYYDCWTDDARLTLETVLAARASGAVVLNHAELVALEKDTAGRLATAAVRDCMTGAQTRVRARCFVNVTGPWLDRVRRLDDAGAPARLMLTKGVHAIFDRNRIRNRDAVVIRGAGDDRVMFAIPWQNQTLVGTTDTYYDGDPAAVAADAADIDYILAAVNRAFPRANLTTADVISTYAGLRPLVAPEDEMQESDISREDEIFESPSGLISLGGGKLTTHRHVAERIVDLAARRIGRRVGRCRTASVALPGAEGMRPGEVADAHAQAPEEHLRRRYGALAPQVGRTLARDGSLARPLVADLPDLRAEVIWAVEQQMALTLEDVLMRRLHVHLRSRSDGDEVAREAARLMAARLGWDEARLEAEVRRYEEALARECVARGQSPSCGGRVQPRSETAQVSDASEFSGDVPEKVR